MTIWELGLDDGSSAIRGSNADRPRGQYFYYHCRDVIPARRREARRRHQRLRQGAPPRSTEPACSAIWLSNRPSVNPSEQSRNMSPGWR